ncbi:MAG TPA: glutamine--fructose-6-phosphate transaminase (isomerizing), partial [Prolixibacteraceae bacterium]|nr:glutamine--fructose-6-phosphate transaminase (isomerizing) [Prolixibacteraceae bacterium]
MCGIVGYIGGKNAYPLLMKGLKRLEYRGYDSSGIALIQNQKINVYKKKGKVNELKVYCSDKDVSGNIGMAHTRWATHGEPNDINAHPHTSMKGLFTIIHNGIIENYDKLHRDLALKGYTFYGQTDTEVLANLIEYMYVKGESVNAELAVRMALSRVIGAYGLVVMCSEEPDRLIAARKSSPLAIGIGQGEFFIGSDATPMIEYTRNVVYLNDNDVAILSRNSFTLKTVDNDEEITPEIQQLELSVGEIEKNGYDHFMLKEIFEQPKTISDSFKGRINPVTKEVFLGGLSEVMPRILDARRIIIIACGTSWHAALIGEYLIEEYAQIPVEVEYASEYRYRKPIINKDDVVLAISQSGET